MNRERLEQEKKMRVILWENHLEGTEENLGKTATALCNLFEQEMKEKDEEILLWHEADEAWTKTGNELLQVNSSLQSRIQQLESEKEERERKAFEAGREKDRNVSMTWIGPGRPPLPDKYETYESYRTLHP